MALKLTTEIFLEVPVTTEITKSGLADLLVHGLAAEGAAGDWHIELVLADDALLRRLHLDFMGLDSPTDIMTFPDHDASGDGLSVTGGQIYISVERAAAQGAEFGLSVADEIRFLVLHGVLHLCGWDDDTDANRAAMLERQAWLLHDFDQSRD